MTDYPALERSPSRMGFTRPPSQRAPDLECLETVVEDDDDDKWDFAGALLIPSRSASSEGSNSSDEVLENPLSLDAMLVEYKPAVPVRTVSLVHLPLHIPVVTQPETAELPYHDAVMQNSPSFEACVVVDHGLSRSALSHLKGFWSARHDEYAKVEAQLALSETHAYGGIWEAPRSREGLRAALLSRLSKSSPRSPYDASPPRTVHPNLNAPIYPRTGDLSTLHDSKSAVLDRAFCNLTLNSINKILFLHDMLERSTTPSPVSPTSALPKDISSDEDDNSFVDISLSSINSRASRESTFVGDESSFCSQHGCRTANCDEKHEAEVVHTTECDRAWEIDWTARWKVLLARVKDDPFLPSSAPATSPVDEKAFWAALNPPKAAKFFIPEEEDEFFGLDSDGEDEDYGVIVSQPAYGLSAESLSREFLQNLCNFRVGMGI